LLIADALTIRGIATYEIVSRVGTRLHALTPWAVVKGAGVTYPPVEQVAYEPRAAPSGWT
jgi:hypothetical protein